MSDTGVICRKSQLIAYPTKIIYDRDNIKDEDFTYYNIANSTYGTKWECKKIAHSTVVTFGENMDSSRPYGVSDDDKNIETSKYPRIYIDYDSDFKCNFKSLHLNPLATHRISGLTTSTSDTAYTVIGECYPATNTFFQIDSNGNIVYNEPSISPCYWCSTPPYYYSDVTVEARDNVNILKGIGLHRVYGGNTTEFKGAVTKIIVGSGIETLWITGCNSLNEIDMSNAYKLKKLYIHNCINIKNIIVPYGVEMVNISSLFSLESLQLPDTIRSFQLSSYTKLFDDSILVNDEINDNGIKISNICCHIGANLESQENILSSSKVILNEGYHCRHKYNSEKTNGAPFVYDSGRTTQFISSCNFDNAIYIGSNVFKTDQYAIAQRKNLCHANFGNNTEEVEFADYAFANSGLKTIVLPKFKKKFGKNVLGGTYVETLIIPDTWDNIDAYSFKATSRLANVTIPKTIKNIGAEAFAGTQLTAVTIAKDCKYVKSAFPSGCTINYYDD